MYYTHRLSYLISILILVLITAPYFAEHLFAAQSTEDSSSIKPLAIKNHTPQGTLSANILEAPQGQFLPFPTLMAEGILVRDLKSNDTLYEKQGTVEFPIASLTKIMTSLLFKERIPFDHEYALFPEATRTVPKVSALPENSLISGEDIIKLMMIDSANDIAYLAAEKIGKTVNFEKHLDLDFKNSLSAAISAMNTRAFELGMLDTNFANPAGLDDGLHYSTPEDLFKLMRYVFEHEPMIWHVSRAPEDVIHYRKSSDDPILTAKIKNTDPLLSKFPRIVGSKTGFTDDAGQAVVLIYQLTSGKNIAIILLKSSDRFGDAEKVLRWLDDNSL